MKLRGQKFFIRRRGSVVVRCRDIRIPRGLQVSLLISSYLIVRYGTVRGEDRRIAGLGGDRYLACLGMTSGPLNLIVGFNGEALRISHIVLHNTGK